MNNGLPKWWFSDKPYIIGDCMDYLPKIPDNSIDLILTDPPYNASENSFKIQNIAGSDYKTIYEEWDLNFDPTIYFTEMYRISKQMLICCSHHQLEIWLKLAKETKHFRQILHLIKTNPIPSARPLYRFSVQYIIWVAKPNYNFKRTAVKLDRFYYLAGCRKKQQHPSIKPLDIMIELLKNHSDEFGIILDPFLGSGTTLLACRNTNRMGIGFEINSKYRQVISEKYMEKIPEIELWLGVDNRC